MMGLLLPWMEIAIATLLVGAIAAFVVRKPDQSKRICLWFSFVVLLLAVGQWLDFSDGNPVATEAAGYIGWQAFEQGIFGVDQLSAPLLPLLSFIFLMTVLSTQRTKVGRFSFGWTLVSEALMLATFSCREPWILIGLLAVAIVPVWLEMRTRAASTRLYSAHMLLFVLILVTGQLLVQFSLAGSAVNGAGWGLLTVALLVRTGIVPFHYWVSDLFDKASFGRALLFVTPMSGAYAVLRLLFPAAPDWALSSMAVVSLVTAVYAAGMALVQREARRVFSYLFLSHSSLVLVGLEMVSPIGLTGALCVWLSVGLSLTGLGITLRSVESRTGRLSLDSYHGLFDQMPSLASFFLLTGLASIGFPGTIGFIGTELLIEGVVGVHPWMGAGVLLAGALSSIAILLVFFRIFTGCRPAINFSMRARPSERLAVVLLSALILGGGILPQPGVHSRHRASGALIEQRRGLQAERQVISESASSAADAPAAEEAQLFPSAGEHSKSG